MIDIVIVVLATLLLAWPVSRWMLRTFDERRAGGPDGFARWVERPLLRVIGVNPDAATGWRGYFAALLLFNLLLGGVAWGVMMTQAQLPLNPDGVPNLSWDLALHTAVSFMTNTNQQHYSGQAQLSYLSQTLALVTLQFVTPACGLAAAVAMLRGLRGGWQRDGKPQPGVIGNFAQDLLRGLLRVFLPLALLMAALLSWQGVPATWSGAAELQWLEPSVAQTTQTLPRGPVAAMVSIKQLGTNGGGWYGPNSATPLENPTPLSNVVQTIALVLLPLACVFMSGPLLGRPRFTTLVFGVMALLSVGLGAATVASERAANPTALSAAPGVNMEGKEVRFGADASALWATLTTQTSNGSVNAMLDSLNPLGGAMALTGMFINSVWGGVGVGLVGFLVHVLVVVFLAGLMVGRTPEFYGRKLDIGTVQMLAVLVVLPPLTIFGLTAIALTVPGIAANSNPGLHGIAQVVYEYSSAFANNGSGFEGLGDNTPWWNLSCVLALLVGRYLPIVLPLAIAARMSTTLEAPQTVASLRIDTGLFAATTVAVILLLTLLTFFPALALGPLGEALQLTAERG